MDYSPELRKLNTEAVCPFYIRTIAKLQKPLQRHSCGIECEPLMERDKLGFKTATYTMFTHWAELINFHEIFCSDMYESCPYYQAMMEIKYKEYQ